MRTRDRKAGANRAAHDKIVRERDVLVARKVGAGIVDGDAACRQRPVVADDKVRAAEQRAARAAAIGVGAVENQCSLRQGDAGAHTADSAVQRQVAGARFADRTGNPGEVSVKTRCGRLVDRQHHQVGTEMDRAAGAGKRCHVLRRIGGHAEVEHAAIDREGSLGQGARAVLLEDAGIDRRAAGIGVGARQRQRSRAVLHQAAGARHRVRQSERRACCHVEDAGAVQRNGAGAVECTGGRKRAAVESEFA